MDNRDLDNATLEDGTDLRESEVALQLGITITAAKKIRGAALAEGTDWRWAGRAVVYTPEGRKKLAAAAGEVYGDDDLGPLPEADLTVVRLVVNPRLIICRDAAGTQVRCKVRAARLYRPGMHLRACKRVGADLYLFQGRPPRRIGHW